MVTPSFFEMNAQTPFEVDSDVTLLDLVKVLLVLLANDRITDVEKLANSHIVPYLDDYLQHPMPVADDDGQPLEAIEVYRCLELSNYESGEDVYDVNSYTCAHGVGAIHPDVLESVKLGKMTAEEAKNCNTYAIEFTPWQKMLHLPIRIRELTYFSESVWKKCPPKEMSFGVLGSKRKVKFGKTEREPVDMKKGMDRKIRWQMNLREFLVGLFNELSFFGSPARRDDKSNELTVTMNDVEKRLKKKKK